MARRSGAFGAWPSLRREVVAALGRGELTVAEVVDALGVGASTVFGWMGAEGRRRGSPSRADRFVAVDVLEEGASAPRPRPVAVVEVGPGISLRVEAGFPAEEVARLVGALRSTC